MPTVLEVFAVTHFQQAYSDASYASYCMIRWSRCRSENTNIQGDNREDATPTAFRTVRVWRPLQPPVDRLEACAFMPNRMGVYLFEA